jgi:pimeloyl-ACP methyl ester carboxylesterase
MLKAEITSLAGRNTLEVLTPELRALGFVSELATLGSATLHYVKGGSGPAVILLHGFPQNWYEWHEVMQRLSKDFTVVAPDARGIGKSTPSPASYDSVTLAKDVQALIEHLRLNPAYIAGHDVGGVVAYALAVLYPQSVRGVMILDSPIPGLAPWEGAKANPKLWHINFQSTPNLPALLVDGRQSDYFDHFFNMGTLDRNSISPEDTSRYVDAYASREQLDASFGFYRAMPETEAFNAKHNGSSDTPLTLAAADISFGGQLEELARTLRQRGWKKVTTKLLSQCGHYIVDEKPAAIAELIKQSATDQL